MRQGFLFGLGLLALNSALVGAQTLDIAHQPVTCAVAEKFPRFDARFAPADAVAVARVLFQGDTKEWYAVVMKADGPAFAGVLPKPKASLKAFRYYIEVTDKSLGINRTAEYTTSVVGRAGECDGKVVATGLGSASVLLQAPAGAAALPAGFASTGVVTAGSAAGSAAAGSSSGAAGAAGAAGVAGAAAATGGGLSGAAVVGIVAGAGAAAAGVAVAAGKGGDSSSSSGNSPAPSPTPSSTLYTGPFSAQMVIQFTYPGGSGVGCQTTTSTHVGAMTMTLQQSSGGAAGSATMNGTRTVVANTGQCGGSGNVVGDTNPINWTSVQVTGSSANLAFTVSSSGAGSAEGISFSGALNGGVINGTLTFTHVLTSGSGNQNGSTTTSVTLR